MQTPLRPNQTFFSFFFQACKWMLTCMAGLLNGPTRHRPKDPRGQRPAATRLYMSDQALYEQPAGVQKATPWWLFSKSIFCPSACCDVADQTLLVLALLVVWTSRRNSLLCLVQFIKWLVVAVNQPVRDDRGAWRGRKTQTTESAWFPDFWVVTWSTFERGLFLHST